MDYQEFTYNRENLVEGFVDKNVVVSPGDIYEALYKDHLLRLGCRLTVRGGVGVGVGSERYVRHPQGPPSQVLSSQELTSPTPRLDLNRRGLTTCSGCSGRTL